MRIHGFLLVATLPMSVITSLGDSTWAYVPAQRNARFVGQIGILRPPFEDAVKVIGVIATAETGSKSMFSLVVTGSTKDGAYETGPEKATEPLIPSDALWPRADDTIVLMAGGRSGTSRLAQTRNPWEMRVGNSIKRSSFVFSCGGTIIGGPAGNVAILNGLVVRRGDPVDGYEVKIITPVDVVLDKSGSLFVIPLGRHITIESISG